MRRRLLGLLGAAVLVVTACGSAATPAPAATATAAPAATATATAAPAATATAAPSATATAAPTAAATASAAPSPSAAASGGTVTWTRFAEVNPVFHPDEATGNEYAFLYLLFSQLVHLDITDPTLQTVIPDLATSWEVSPDAKVFTFKLRSGVTWSDGTPFTADDVVYSATWAAENRNAYIGFAPGWGKLEGQAAVQAACDANPADATKCGGTTVFAGVKKVDDSTVQFTLAEPNVTFLRGLAESQNSIIPKHLLVGQTADQVNKGDFKTKAPIGTGPFTLSQVAPDQFVEFHANPTYYKGAPKLEKVIYKTITTETALAQIQTGELDIILSAGAANFPVLSKVAILDTRVVSSPGIFTFQPNAETNAQRAKWKTDQNLDLPPLNFDFSDKRVRQALAYAIDRRTINDQLFGGQNKILWNPPGFDPDIPGLDKYDFNPDKAKQLLQAAAADGKVDLSKTIKFMYATDLNDGGKIAPIVKTELEAVGLKVELNGILTDAWLKIVSDNTQRGTYDITFDAGGNEGLGPEKTVPYVLCGSKEAPNGFDGYENCDVRALFAKALTQLDETARAQTYAEIAKVLNDEIPQVYLWQLAGIHVVNKRVQNVTIPAFERWMFMAVDTWTVTQ